MPDPSSLPQRPETPPNPIEEGLKMEKMKQQAAYGTGSAPVLDQLGAGQPYGAQ